MKKLFILFVIVLAVSAMCLAQTFAPTTDVLGAHQNNGRGCAGCHAPHSGSRGSGQDGTGDSGNYALWGQDVGPIAGTTLAFGDGGKYIEVLPATLTAGGTEVSGILTCLSCHDGNLTKNNMMAKQAYEQVVGLLPTYYGTSPIPTLLGADGSSAGNYSNDHPVGVNATVSVGNGLVEDANGKLTVSAGTPYATFVSNYGWPALAPGKWSAPTGVNSAKKAYVVCTTCHNQHVMNVYAASANSPVAGATSGYYSTFFFINGPYNVNANPATLGGGQASSTTQFCRQCHFGESNEANNALTITTAF